jgi:hypothetical protein
MVSRTLPTPFTFAGPECPHPTSIEHSAKGFVSRIIVLSFYFGFDAGPDITFPSQITSNQQKKSDQKAANEYFSYFGIKADITLIAHQPASHAWL